MRRLVLLPKMADVGGHRSSRDEEPANIEDRVRRSVDWYLDTVGEHGRTFVAVTGAEGVGADPEVEQILAEADDLAARAVLQLVGLDPDADRQRAAIRAYGGLAKAAVREWIGNRSLTREQVHVLLSSALLAVLREVLPGLREDR